MSGKGFTRRHFFYGSLLAGAVPTGGFGSTPSLKMLGYKSPNEKLNIASIGAGGKAASDIRGCATTENIVALCDVDDKHAAAIFKEFEKPPKYKDFRKMLDKEGTGIDAVIVTIPDFMHATAAYNCMERGKHVYVQKPLTRTIWEARLMREAANKYKVATQMGNQGYSNEGTRQAAEMVWAGEIGNVTEVHAWTNRPIWPQGLTEIPAPTPVPDTLDWDLWLGIANERPYTSGGEGYPTGYARGNFYQPFNWRGFYDFGCGALGDMACHILGAPNMALKLGLAHQRRVHQEGRRQRLHVPQEVGHPLRFPGARQHAAGETLLARRPEANSPRFLACPRANTWAICLRCRAAGTARRAWRTRQAADRGAAPDPRRPEGTGPVFTWSKIEALREHPPTRPTTPDGSLFIGDKGMMTTGTYGEDTRLIPVDKMKDYEFPPEILTRSPGHYHDWIRSC